MPEREVREAEGGSQDPAPAAAARIAAGSPQAWLQLQQAAGNRAVASLVTGRPLQRWAGFSVRPIKILWTYEARRDDLVSRIGDLRSEKLSRRAKHKRITDLLNAMSEPDRKRLATDAQFKRQLRRRLSDALYESVVADVEALESGEEIIGSYQGAMGHLTVTGGDVEEVTVTGMSARARRFEADLRDPVYAKQIRRLVPVMTEGMSAADTVLDMVATAQSSALDEATEHLKFRPEILKGTSAPLALRHGFHLMRLTHQVLTITDPEERAKLLEELSDNPAVGVPEILERAAKATEGVASLCGVLTYAVARSTGMHVGKTLGFQASKMLLMTGKAVDSLGAAADLFTAVKGVAKVITGDRNERVEGAVEAVGGGLQFGGAVAGAARVSALGLAVEGAWLEAKMAAKLYGMAMGGMLAPAVDAEYEGLRREIRAVAVAQVEARQWEEARLRALEAGDEIRIELALGRLRAALPPFQRALRAAVDMISRLRYEVMKESFKRSEALKDHLELALADPASDPVSVHYAASLAADELFRLTDELWDDGARVMKGAIGETADRFHGRTGGGS